MYMHMYGDEAGSSVQAVLLTFNIFRFKSNFKSSTYETAGIGQFHLCSSAARRRPTADRGRNIITRRRLDTALILCRFGEAWKYRIDTMLLPLWMSAPRLFTRASPAPRMALSPEDDFALLSRRILELKQVHSLRGFALHKPLLPRQQLRIESMPASFADIVRECEATNSTLGVLGVDIDGTTVLQRGVEVSISEVSREFNDCGYGEPYVYSATLTGGRLFECVPTEAADAAAVQPGDLFASDVKFLDLELSDQMSAAQSPSRVVDLASRELTVLVQQWEELARGGGVTLWGKPRRQPSLHAGSADHDDAEDTNAAVTALLDSLGPFPEPNKPSERALWVAALITAGHAGGLPEMKIQIGPSMLTATTPLQRLSVAKTGLIDSIYRMKGGNWPLATFYWR